MILRCSAALGLVALLTFPGASMAGADSQRTVIASGSASVAAAPDFARVQMAVTARAVSVDDARNAVNARISAFLEFAETMDIDERHIDTTGLQIYPVYEQQRPGRNQEPEIRGYSVQRNIRLRLDDLDRLGELFEGATAAGINSISPPALDTTRRNELHRAVLQQATEDARQNAEASIQGLGVRLGTVRTLRTSSQGGGMAVAFAARGMVMAEAAQSYQAADIQITAQVEATFDLDVID